MNDKGKIAAGAVIFLILITFPIWFTNASGKTGYKPDPELPAGLTRCVESTEFMRDNHMELLDQWRDEAVRNGSRVYVANDGSRYDISLQNTCMKCHSNKDRFCDRCHEYVGIAPYCWDCHVEPKGE